MLLKPARKGKWARQNFWGNLVSGVATNFFDTFPGNSLTVLRLQQQPDSPVNIMLNGATNQQPIAALSNGLALRLSSFITSPASVNYTVDSPAVVLTTGTVQFMPGDLAKTIAFALGDLGNSRIIRVTLSNPAGAQLAGPTPALLREFARHRGPAANRPGPVPG